MSCSLCQQTITATDSRTDNVIYKGNWMTNKRVPWKHQNCPIKQEPKNNNQLLQHELSIRRLYRINNDLKSKIQQIDDKYTNTIKQQKDDNKHIIDEFKNKITNWQQKYSTLNEMIQTINKEKSDLMNERNSDQQKINKIESELARLHTIIDNLNHMNHTLQYENNKCKLENDALRKQVMNNINDQYERKNDDNADDAKCKQKFEDWLCMKQYLQSFEQNEYNDIRLIQFFSDSILQNDIGIQKLLHRKLILVKANEVKILQNEFKTLLDHNKELKQYRLAFENNGILTLKDLYSDIKSKQKLKEIMNVDNEHQLNNVWKMIHTQNDKHYNEGQMTEHH